MGSDFHNSLEPFPLFIDSAPPNSANYFSSPMAMAAIQLLASSSDPYSHDPCLRKSRVSVPAKVSNYFRLRYYQYEVTFGLYVMTPAEKLVFNSIILFALCALLYALFYGLEPFVVNSVCRLLYYVTGSTSSAAQLCS
jgi:hypothetical protein